MRMSVRAKLLGSAAILLAFTGIVGAIGIVGMGAVSNSGQAMLEDGVKPLHSLEQLNANLLERARLASNAMAYVSDPKVQTDTDAAIAAMDKTIDANIAAFEASNPTASEAALMANFKDAVAKYRVAGEATRAYTRTGQDTPPDLVATAKTVRANAMAIITDLIKANLANAAQLDDAINSTYDQSLLLTAAGIIGALVLGLLVALWMARKMTADARKVQQLMRSMVGGEVAHLDEALSALAANDLTRTISPSTQPAESYGTDEIGQTVQTANEMLGRLASIMDSYEGSRQSLVRAVSEVQAASRSVAQTSETLTSIANQVSSASGQVASTIGQVAAGAGDQASAASAAARSMSELVGDVSHLGAGADQTATRVSDTVATIQEMTRSIETAAAASSEVDSVATRAATAADHGTGAVRETVTGMRRIKSAVEGAAAKVTELGSKSDQIGAIVEAIDDIAEQTNLLALNAAIEAARAGEQGKGFAVVADEVRKLAERASRATKEIGALIGEVQQGTAEAVAAMQVGATEVEQGAILADRAGRSLDEIADAVMATKSASDSITASVNALTGASRRVMEGMDEIGVVAKENASAGQAMTRSADETSRAVESIAAVAEENSAAAEEVSAATEELSAQANELVSSAGSLAQMAVNLDQLVAGFRIDDSSGEALPANAVPRRRASDWRSDKRAA